MRKKSTLLLALFVSMIMSVFSTSTALFSDNNTFEANASADTIKISHVKELADKALTAGSWEATAVVITNDSLKNLDLETELSISKSLPKGVRIEINDKPAFVNKTTEVYKYGDLKPSDITTYDIRIYYDKGAPGEIMKGGNFTINVKTVGSLKGTKWKTAELTSSAKISYAEFDNKMTAPVVVNTLDLENKKITLKANVRDENNVLSTIDISGKSGNSWLENTSDTKGDYQKGSLETYFDYKLESIEYSSEYPDSYEIAFISPEVKGGNAKLTKPTGNKIVLNKTVRDLLNVSEGQLNFVMVPKMNVPIKVNDPVDDVLIIKDSAGNTVSEVNLKGVTTTTATVDKYEYDVDVPMSKINNLDYLYNPIKLTGSLKDSSDTYEVEYGSEFEINKIRLPLFKFREAWGDSYYVDGFVDNIDEAIVDNELESSFKNNPIIPSTHNGKPVISVGKNAFANSQLTSVVMPDSIREINSRAFMNNQLTSAIIPDDVRVIDYDAFKNNKLTSIEIPNSVTEIGYEAFADNELESVKIPDSRILMQSGVFRNNKLRSVKIPNSMRSITSNTFYDNMLTSVDIPDSVTTIGESAFAGNKIESLIIPDSVTEIRKGAFSSNMIKSLVIPSSVTKIGERAFSGNQLTEVNIPNSITKIEDSTFSSNSLISLVIPDSVTEIGVEAFRYNKLTSVTIPDSVTSIGDSAFVRNQLRSVEIPDSVTELGDKAFKDNRLKSVKLSNSLTTINLETFDSNYLESIEIPDSVTKIERHAFTFNWLTSIEIPSSVTEIGVQAFYSNELASVSIPNSLSVINDGAFDGNPGGIVYANELGGDSWRTLRGYEFESQWELESYDDYVAKRLFVYSELSDGTYSIDGFVDDVEEIITDKGLDPDFRYNPILPAMHNGKAVTSIGEQAFSSRRLTSVIIPDSVTSVGDSAFRYNQLTSVEIPNSVISIGESAFEYNQLTSIVIPDSVISVGEYAFNDNQLTSVKLGSSITKIERRTFAWNHITEVVLPNSMTAIGEYAFSMNPVKLLVIPDSVTSLERNAFDSPRSDGIIYANEMEEDSWPTLRGYIFNRDRWSLKPLSEYQP